jgi:hypothetical protein
MVIWRSPVFELALFVLLDADVLSLTDCFEGAAAEIERIRVQRWARWLFGRGRAKIEETSTGVG